MRSLKRILSESGRAAAVAALSIVIPAASSASSVQYSGTSRVINACVLVSNAASIAIGTSPNQTIVQNNPVPYLFYALNLSTSYKPAGWQFTNTLAPSVITQPIYNRWAARETAYGTTDPAFQSGTAQALSFQVGLPLTQNMGAYWEENLDTISQQSLDQYNVVFMPLIGGRFSSSNPFDLDENERQKLAQYVASGGNLWVEDEVINASSSDGSNFIVPFTAPTAAFAAPLNVVNQLHPILNTPDALSTNDVNAIIPSTPYSGQALVAPGGGFVDPASMEPVFSDANPNALLYAGTYGNGQIVLSGLSIGETVSDSLGGFKVEAANGTGNNGAVSGSSTINTPSVDLKLAYNIVGWSNAGNGNSSAVENDTPTTLGLAWDSVPTTFAGLGSGAAISNNLVYGVDGNNILHAYNTTPGTSLGGYSLYNDNGLQDYSIGYPYDQIWQTSLGSGAWGTPVVSNFFLPSTGQTQSLVSVTSENGTTTVFQGTGRTNGALNSASSPIFSVTTGNASGTDNFLNPNASTNALPGPGAAYQDGILFCPVYSNGWRVDAINLPASEQSGSAVSAFGTSGSPIAPSVGTSTTLPGDISLTGPLSVDMTTNSATGALDEVVCLPYQTDNSTTSGGVDIMRFRTYGEPLIANTTGTASVAGDILYQPGLDRSLAPWFDNTAGNQSLLPVIHISQLDANGVVTGVTTYSVGNYGGIQFFDGLNKPPYYPTNIPSLPGQHYMEVDIPQTDLGVVNAGGSIAVTADYTLDWSGDQINGYTPNSQDMQTIVAGKYGMYSGNSGSLYQSISGGVAVDSNGSALFAAGSSNFEGRVYSIIPGSSGTFGSIAPDSTRLNWMWSPTDAATEGTMNVLQRLTYDNEPVTAFRPIGKPAVLNGTAYVVGQASINGSIPATVILALNDQSSGVVSLNPPIQISSGFGQPQVSLTVEQPDLVATSGTNSILQPNVNYTIVTSTDSTGITYASAIDFTNLQSPNGDALNSAEPIDVVNNTSGQTTVLTNSSGYGPLDNLQWYAVIPTAQTTLGEPLPLPGLPTSGPSLSNGNLYYSSQDAIISLNLANALSDKGAYHKSLSGVLQPDYSVTTVMKQITSSLNQPVVQTIIYPPTVGENMVVANSPAGIAAFNNTPTLIADGNRIMEVDASGSPLWTMDASDSSTTIPTAITGANAVNEGQLQSVPFSAPSAVHETSPGVFTVADKGNNRIVQVDQGGHALMEIHSFSDDMHMLIPGEPTTLSSPSDVQVYTDNEPSTTSVLSYISTTTNVTYTYTGPYIATHYIIADTGNHRAIEIVDAMNPITGLQVQLTPSVSGVAPVTMYHQVVFTTRSLPDQNALWKYRTIEEFADPLNANTIDMVAAVDNLGYSTNTSAAAQAQGFASPANLQAQAGKGALLFISRAPGQNGATLQAATTFNVMGADGTTIVGQQQVDDPTTFTEFYYRDPATGTAVLHYLMADANGCYEFKVDPTTGGLDTVWMLTNTDYEDMTGHPLHALSIQRLPSSDYYTDAGGVTHFAPHYLITNGYHGSDGVFEWQKNLGIASSNVILDGRVTGEVFEIASAPYYSSTTSVVDSAGASTAMYNGYQQIGYAEYMLNSGLLTANPVAAVLQMIPNLVYPSAAQAGPIIRTLGSAGNPTTGTLDAPVYAIRG